MEMESCVPPGFRFHPTEEELVGYYLNRKINSLSIDLDVIIDLDLYKMEPWDIQDQCKLGYEEQSEWYFFSHKDRKYPTGTRTNRATNAGFWKATGRDKAVVSKDRIIGMRKTLVFYRGRAPNGRKTDWIMHEYRLQSTEHGPPQDEGWVVCRAFKKPTPSHKQGFEAWNSPYNTRNCRPPSYHGTLHAMPSFDSDHNQETSRIHQMLDLPKLESPPTNGFEQSSATMDDNNNEDDDQKGNLLGDQFISDWKIFDKLMERSAYEYSNMSYSDGLDNVSDHQSHFNQ